MLRGGDITGIIDLLIVETVANIVVRAWLKHEGYAVLMCTEADVD